MNQIGVEHLRQIDISLDDGDIVRDRMASARELMLRQVAADDVRSGLCDLIATERERVRGLNDAICELERSSPELYIYLNGLERINASIWCPKCQSIKSVGRDFGPDNIPGMYTESAPFTYTGSDIYADSGHLARAVTSHFHDELNKVKGASRNMSDAGTKLTETIEEFARTIINIYDDIKSIQLALESVSAQKK